MEGLWRCAARDDGKPNSDFQICCMLIGVLLWWNYYILSVWAHYRHTVMLQISHWKGIYVLNSSCLRTRGIILNCASDQKQCRMSSSKLLSHLLYLHCSFPRGPCLLWQDAQGLFYLMLYGITAVIWDICFSRWTWDGEIDWRRFKSSHGVWGTREDQFNTALPYNTPYLQCFHDNSF